MNWCELLSGNRLMLAMAAGGAVASGASALVCAAERADDVTKMVMIDHGQKVELELRNGEIFSVKIDGKDAPKERVKREGESYIVTDEAGKEIARVEMPKGEELGKAQKRVVVRSRELDGKAQELNARARELGALAREHGARGQAMEDALAAVGRYGVDAGEAPKTMLGVTPVEPSEELAAQLGVKAEESTLLSSVAKDLAAAKAGLKKHDVIVAIDGKTPAGPGEVRKLLRERSAGDKVTFTIIRAGKREDVSVTLEAFDRTKIGAVTSAFNEANNAFGGQGLTRLHEMLKDVGGEEGARVFNLRVPAPPATPGAPMVMMRGGIDSDELSDKLDKLEERLERIEAMLEKLAKGEKK
jgi:hypothetical protein